jgi:hypothetical protein
MAVLVLLMVLMVPVIVVLVLEISRCGGGIHRCGIHRCRCRGGHGRGLDSSCGGGGR